MVEEPPEWLKPFLPLSSSSRPTVLALHEEEKQKNENKPTASLCPVLQGSAEEELLSELPPYLPPPQAELQNAPGEAVAAPVQGEGPPLQTRRRVQRGQTRPVADSTVLPLRAIGPLTEAGNQQMQYWLFATSDLYNWKLQMANFSEKPQGLIDLLESILFTHQPTSDDIQQLLQVLFTTEERDLILTEARKLVPGVDGSPTTNQVTIDEAFLLVQPNWDFNVAEGKERLRIYRQTLMGGLRAAVRRPTNLAKVNDVQQGKTESPAAFLERIFEAFRTYTPMDPEAPENKNAVILAFVNQSALDIR